MHGDATEDPIYLAVGRCLTQWELVEFVFSLIFGALVAGDAKGQQGYFARRAYGLIVSSAGRSAMLREVADGFFYLNKSAAAEKDDLALLLKHFDSGGEARNRIAHGTATRWTLDNTNHGVFLEPPDYATKKTNHRVREPFAGTMYSMTKVAYRYTSDQILEFGGKFVALKEEVKKFHLAFAIKFGPQLS